MRLYKDSPSGTVPQARQLRREAPEPELRLLRAVREAFPNHKWRHQTPIGSYFVDIFCFAEKLVIEVDGDTHADSEAHDAARTHFLNNEGYRVIRFTNNDVMQTLDGVVATISLSLGESGGARKARKSEDGPGMGKVKTATLPSPSHTASRRGPLPLPKGEE